MLVCDNSKISLNCEVGTAPHPVVVRASPPFEVEVTSPENPPPAFAFHRSAQPPLRRRGTIGSHEDVIYVIKHIFCFNLFLNCLYNRNRKWALPGGQGRRSDHRRHGLPDEEPTHLQPEHHAVLQQPGVPRDSRRRLALQSTRAPLQWQRHAHSLHGRQAGQGLELLLQGGEPLNEYLAICRYLRYGNFICHTQSIMIMGVPHIPNSPYSSLSVVIVFFVSLKIFSRL